jgi:fused signal recognition particle receptor
MFGKIKDKLKGVFEKSEDLIEENSDSEEDVLIEDLPDKAVEKKGFLSRVFSKKEEVESPDEDILEEIEPVKEEKKNSKNPEVKKEIKKTNTKKTKEKPKSTISENIDEELKKEVSKKEYKDPVSEFKLPQEKFIANFEESKEKIKEELKEEHKEIGEPLQEKKKGFLGRIFSKKEDEPEVEEKLEVTSDRIEQEETKENESFLSKTFTKLKAKKITDEDFEKIWIELEIFLLEINIAYEIVQKIEEKLKEELVDNSFNRFKLTEKIKEVLASEVEIVLKDREGDFLNRIKEIKEKESLVKIIILGVNGTGKTTTIAKIVNYFQKNNLKTVVAAADTFRAAAIEQLEEHSKKLDFKLIRHKGGSDPAAVAYDAIEHAKSKNLDVVLIDTAGRMPNNSNLMVELQKIKRISEAQLTIFIGDSISGNDLIDQIELFDKAMEIDGVILTKVDTDERPGSIVTTAYSIEKPIFFLGAGQTYEDLIKFDAKEIAKKLFEEDDD